MNKLVIALLCLTLFACKKTETIVENQTPPPEKEIIDTNQWKGFPDIQVEKLIRSAEALMHPAGYVFALEILDEVLEKEPTNKKALFYKALFEPFKYYKGIYSKVLPYVKKNLPHRYPVIFGEANVLPDGGLRDFLFAEAEVFKDENEISDFILEFAHQLEKSRQFFKEHRNLVTTIRFSEVTDKSYFENCTVIKRSPGVYYAPTCNGMISRRLDVNRADMELLQVFTAGFQVYLTMATGYSLDGLSQMDRHEYSTGFETSLEKLNYLKAIESFGKLKSNNQFNIIKELGADMISSFKWAKKLERHLCPFGKDNLRNRQGSLFEKGYCLSFLSDNFKFNSSDLVLSMLDFSLSGKTPKQIDFNVSKNPNAEYGTDRPPYRTEWVHNPHRWPKSWEKIYIKKTPADPFKPLDSMPQDLRTFFPVHNECGWPIQIDDPTFNGLFPNGDGLEIISGGHSEGADRCTPSLYYTKIANPKVQEAVVYQFLLDTFETRLVRDKDYVQLNQDLYLFRINRHGSPTKQIDSSETKEASGHEIIQDPPLNADNSVKVNLKELRQLADGKWVQDYWSYRDLSWGGSLIDVSTHHGRDSYDKYLEYYKISQAIIFQLYVFGQKNRAWYEHWIDENMANFPMGTKSSPLHFQEVPKEW